MHQKKKNHWSTKIAKQKTRKHSKERCNKLYHPFNKMLRNYSKGRLTVLHKQMCNTVESSCKQYIFVMWGNLMGPHFWVQIPALATSFQASKLIPPYLFLHQQNAYDNLYLSVESYHFGNVFLNSISKNRISWFNNFIYYWIIFDVH